jgi:succinate-semialdehyde dehydrogenase/glutarate-semialdehyde dehydrogenase
VTEKFNTSNPATGEVLKEFPTACDEEISAVIDASDTAFQAWRTIDVHDRAAPLARAADLMDERRWDLAELLTLEMGKLLAEAEAEVGLAARILRYYAEEGPCCSPTNGSNPPAEAAP